MERITVKQLKEILSKLPKELDDNYIILIHNSEVIALEYISDKNIRLLDIQKFQYSTIQEKTR